MCHPVFACVFFFTDTATTEIYTLSLHDALPISASSSPTFRRASTSTALSRRPGATSCASRKRTIAARSEEHTSELQSHSDLVCRLLLEKKKKNETYTRIRQLSHSIAAIPCV